MPRRWEMKLATSAPATLAATTEASTHSQRLAAR